MPKWLRTWLIGFTVFCGVHWLFSTLLGWDGFLWRSTWEILGGAFAFASVLAWLRTLRDKPQPPDDI